MNKIVTAIHINTDTVYVCYDTLYNGIYISSF